jgi:hypothetical protein
MFDRLTLKADRVHNGTKVPTQFRRRQQIGSLPAAPIRVSGVQLPQRSTAGRIWL